MTYPTQNTVMSTNIPPFYKLISTFENDHEYRWLRLGQWFIIRYMPRVLDHQLFNETDTQKALNRIKVYYESYQWCMLD